MGQPFVPTSDKTARKGFSRSTDAARKEAVKQTAKEGKKNYQAPKLTMSRNSKGCLLYTSPSPRDS